MTLPISISSVILYNDMTGDTTRRRGYLPKLICELGTSANHHQRDGETENEPGHKALTAVPMNRVYCQV